MDVPATLKASDWVIVFATLFGPVLAVQAQKWIEALRAHQQAKGRIFSVLMATRAARLSPAHVEALNMIDVAFYGRRVLWWRWQKDSERRVSAKWAEYLDSLDGTKGPSTGSRNPMEVFYELLESMARDLGLDFDRATIKNNVYSPVAHGNLERDMTAIREGVLAVLDGRAKVKVAISADPGGAAGGPRFS